MTGTLTEQTKTLRFWTALDASHWGPGASCSSRPRLPPAPSRPGRRSGPTIRPPALRFRWRRSWPCQTARLFTPLARRESSGATTAAPTGSIVVTRAETGWSASAWIRSNLRRSTRRRGRVFSRRSMAERRGSARVSKTRWSLASRSTRAPPVGFSPVRIRKREGNMASSSRAKMAGRAGARSTVPTTTGPTPCRSIRSTHPRSSRARGMAPCGGARTAARRGVRSINVRAWSGRSPPIPRDPARLT